MRNLVIMLLGLFLFCSCSSSDSFENVDVNNVMSEESLQEDQLVSVQSQIESLNQEMFTSSNETRGFWKFFTKIVVDNNGEFMNRALIIVDKSSLDEITKNNLRNAFIVGNASYQLWNTEN